MSCAYYIVTRLRTLLAHLTDNCCGCPFACASNEYTFYKYSNSVDGNVFEDKFEGIKNKEH